MYFCLCLFLHFHEPCNKILKHVASPVKDVHDMPQRNVALNVASLVKDVHDTLQKNVASLMKDVCDMIYKNAVSLEMGCNDKFCMNEILRTQDLIYTCSSYSY